MSVKEKDPKALKKKLIQQRNKRDLKIWKHLKEHHTEEERLKEEEEMREHARRRAASTPTTEAEVWSAKAQQVRNRLTNKKRASKERWNRFAGTSGGGARGL